MEWTEILRIVAEVIALILAAFAGRKVGINTATRREFTYKSKPY